jgi:hypothetical protein
MWPQAVLTLFFFTNFNALLSQHSSLWILSLSLCSFSATKLPGIYKTLRIVHLYQLLHYSEPTYMHVTYLTGLLCCVDSQDNILYVHGNMIFISHLLCLDIQIVPSNNSWVSCTQTQGKVLGKQTHWILLHPTKFKRGKSLHLSHASLFSQMCCELGTELTHLQDRKRKEGDGKGRRQIGLGVLGLLTAGC